MAIKKAEVEIGAVYLVGVSGIVSRVKILRESPYGGWDRHQSSGAHPVRPAAPQEERQPDGALG